MKTTDRSKIRKGGVFRRWVGQSYDVRGADTEQASASRWVGYYQICLQNSRGPVQTTPNKMFACFRNVGSSRLSV